MTNEFEVLGEPLLEFRYGQKLRDPRSGLALFGAYDADTGSKPGAVNYGLIGTPEGISAFQSFANQTRAALIAPEFADDPLLWPAFPGFQAAFDSDLPKEPAWTQRIDRDTLLYCARDKDAAKRVYSAVNHYLAPLETLAKRHEKFGVIFCVVPDEVRDNCRPLSVVRDGHGYVPSKQEVALRTAGQDDLFGDYDLEEYQYSLDFRRQLKARALIIEPPLQLVRESTLDLSKPSGESGHSPTSDRAWNLLTTAYYKAGGKPWRLSSAREGVCYIGIAFKKQNPTGRTACCAAQMFLDSGDGIVFLGEFGPWYSPETRQCHLDASAAERLLSGVLDTYRQLGGQPLKEIFLHSRSTIDAEEFAGFEKARPHGVKLVGIRIRLERDGVRAFRPGHFPVIRGTFWRQSERTGYLWASGFKPTIGTYDGWEVPAPLRIEIEHGESDITQVAADVLGLTKLNYNACRVGDSEPVTIGFSDAVGEILVSNPSVASRRHAFKYYI